MIQDVIKSMFHRVRLYLGLIRFSHTIFALPFALTAAALAWRIRGSFSWLDLLGILLCMVTGRSAAMAVNRLADRRFDAANPRTAQRHLPAGFLGFGGVALFAAMCMLAFTASTALFLVSSSNPWPLFLSIPVLGFICCYSFAKRFTFLAHFWLGASLMLAPVGAWIAVSRLVQLEIPFTLGLIVLFWVAGFDIIYACQDVDFDKKARLHSLPARFGVGASLRIAFFSHLTMVVLLLGLCWIAAPYLGIVYLIGVLAIAFLLVYEHWLVRPDDLSRVNQAFFHVNAVISLGLFALVLVQLWVNG